MVKPRNFCLVFLILLFLNPNTVSANFSHSIPTSTSLTEPYFSSPFPGHGSDTGIRMASSSSFPGLLLTTKLYPSGAPLPIYSLNGGLSWNAVPTRPWESFPDFYSITSVAIAPRPNQGNTPRIFVGISTSLRSTYEFTPTVFSNLLYRSGGFGDVWTAVDLTVDETFITACTPGGYENSFSIYLYVSPADPTRLYLALTCNVWEDYFGYFYKSLYTSSDSGITWNLFIPLTSDNDFGDESFVVSPVLPQRVYILRSTYSNGSKQLQWFQSDDAGQTTNLSFPAAKLELDPQDPSKLYIIGSRSIDGGAHWVEWAEQPCPSSIYDFSADTETSNVLYLECPDGFYLSANGGDHWEKVSDYGRYRLIPDLGNPGRLLGERADGLWESTDQGRTWKHVTDNYTTPAFIPWENITPPDGFRNDSPMIGIQRDLVTFGEDAVWALSGDHTNWRWTDNTWQRVIGSFTAGDFLSPDYGWTINDHTIYRWSGQSFDATYQVDASLQAVEAVSENDAWAVGYTHSADLLHDIGKIYHWNGISWDESYSIMDWPLIGIKMTSADEGWAFAWAGLLLRWKNHQWSVYDNRPEILNAMEMVSATDGWIVGGNQPGFGTSVILHWNGTDWQSVDHPTGKQLFSISFQSSDDGWAAGEKMLLHWDGANWTDAGFDPAYTYENAFVLPNGEFWLVLPDAIFRYRQVKQVFLPIVSR